MFAFGKRRIDVAPLLIRVGLEAALAVGHILGERQVELLERDVHAGRGLRVGQDDAVVADLYLGDLLHAVLRAALHLGLLDRPGSVADVGSTDPDPLAEQLEAAARAGAFDHRRLEAGRSAEFLGDARRKRIHRRRTHDANLVPRLRRARRHDANEDRHGQDLACHQVLSLSLLCPAVLNDAAARSRPSRR